MEAKSTEISVFALSQAAALDLLPQIATVQPPHRLEESSPNCAMPAIIDENPVLIWRHQLLSQSVFELHTTVGILKQSK